MHVQHLAAFSENGSGGNPAGVVIGATLPEQSAMQAMAAELGYAETVFAAPHPEGWRVRYFAPEREVPFCGHATIALGAALAAHAGDGEFRLQLNDMQISVTGSCRESAGHAELISPPTEAQDLSEAALQAALQLFGLSPEDLAPDWPAAVACAGNRHLILPLRSRQKLAEMAYSLEEGRALMRQEDWVTVALLWREADDLLHVRNAFAWGGLTEDPATGSAAAAIGGYLQRRGQLPEKGLVIRQGGDMGVPCVLNVQAAELRGQMAVAGAVRWMRRAG